VRLALPFDLGSSQGVDMVDDFGQPILESPADAIRPRSIPVPVLKPKSQSTGGDPNGRGRGLLPLVASRLGPFRRWRRRGVLLLEQSEREMLAAGHNDQARLLDADENLVSPPQCFVGQLLKDRPASGKKRLRDIERGQRRPEVDRWPLDSLLGDQDLRWLRGPRRLNDPRRLGVVLQQPDHHVAMVPAGVPELKSLRDQSPLFGRIDGPAVLGPNPLAWISDADFAIGGFEFIH